MSNSPTKLDFEALGRARCKVIAVRLAAIGKEQTALAEQRSALDQEAAELAAEHGRICDALGLVAQEQVEDVPTAKGAP